MTLFNLRLLREGTNNRKIYEEIKNHRFVAYNLAFHFAFLLGKSNPPLLKASEQKCLPNIIPLQTILIQVNCYRNQLEKQQLKEEELKYVLSQLTRIRNTSFLCCFQSQQLFHVLRLAFQIKGNHKYIKERVRGGQRGGKQERVSS